MAKVFLFEGGKLHPCDLLVVPFDGDSPADAPPLDDSFCASWVMIYGLENRRIWVFRKKMAVVFLASARRYRVARKILGLAKVARPLKECLRMWKRLFS